MKILFVRTYCPNQIFYGSEMRAARHVDYFRQKGQVDLLTLTSPGKDANTAYIRTQFGQHHYFDQSGDHQRIGKLEKFLYFLPWQLMDFYAKDLQKKLNAILEKNQYDMIFVFKLDPVFYFLKLPLHWRKRVVLDFDDILSDVYRDQYKDFFTSQKNSRALKLYEQKALVQFRRVFVCSRDALVRFRPKGLDKVGVIPNIFAADAKEFMTDPGPPDRLLFVGSLDYSPNLEGLKWFCKHIWPEFLKVYPQVILTVVGKIPKDARHITELLGDPKNMKVTVNVPSVAPYYSNCYATIVPLLNGSGTRLKILESASFGRPVITTAKGAEGLDFEHGKNIFIFEDSAAFIKAYQDLLVKDKYVQVAQSALGVLKERYSPEVFLSLMNENWRSMV